MTTLNHTPAGETKELVIFNDERGNVKLKFTGGGSLPERLSGTYTSVREAEKAIEAYMSTKKKTDAKSKE